MRSVLLITIFTGAQCVGQTSKPTVPSDSEDRASSRTSVEAVEFEASDGFRLAARLYRAASTGPGVLLLHQGDRATEATGYEPLAEMLAKRGVHALVLDFRGYGGSVNERFTGKNWQEARPFFDGDVEAALTFLSNRRDVDARRLAIVGASVGGRYATAVAKQRAQVRALCLISANLGRAVSVTLAGLAERPVLCIAAEADPFARAAAAAREAFALSKNPNSQLIVYKGDRHGAPLFEHDPQLSATIATWLAARLDASRD